jgi:phosphoribosylformylglycinamidine cyclo-ligase
LPAGLGALIERGAWDIPPICTYLVERGGVPEAEAFHALNMGLGMLVVTPASDVAAALAAAPEARRVGRVTGEPGVRLA